MIVLIAQIIISLAIGFLATIGSVGFFRPEMVWSFWAAFASTRAINTTEAIVRGVIGAAVVVDAQSFLKPEWAVVAGWFLMLSAAIIGIFYDVHHRFAAWVVPPLQRLMRLHSLSAVSFAIFLLWAWRPGTLISP